MVDGVMSDDAFGFVVVFAARVPVPVKARLQSLLEQNVCR